MLFIFLAASTHASSQQLHFKHFTVDEGLPSNEVYQVLQDTSGKLLIATDRGAVQYDGYSFQPASNKKELTSKPVYYIYRSPKGQVYFSSLQGIIYQYQNDTLNPFPFNDRTASLFQHPGILIANSISAQQDTVWISFNNDYNYNYKIGSCFVTADGTVGKIRKEDGLYFDLTRDFYYRQSSPAGNSNPTQPLTITWENGQITRDEVSLNWRSGYIRRLFKLKCGAYDLFSIGRYLVVYKDQKKVSSYLFPENVLYVTSLQKDEIYVGFENRGASLYRLQAGQIRAPAANHLNGLSVTSIFQDKEGGLWLSTLENGLFYSYPSRPRLWDNRDKIAHIEKRKSKTFVGFNAGLIQTFSGDQLLQEFQLPLATGSYFYRFAFDYNDSLIAITDKGYFTRKEGRWRFVPGNDILLSPAGKDLVYGASAYTAALHVYAGLGKPLLQTQQLSKRIISMHVRSPKEVWIGTWDGLLKYDQDRLTDMSKVNSVFNERIVSIGELSTKDLVVASLGKGLAVYKNDNVYQLNTGNGLRSPIINSMVVQQDSIWIGSNKGLTLALFEKDSFRTVHLGLESGLPSLDIQQFSVSNGWVYIKWVNKLVTLHVAGLLQTDKSNRTNITSVVVNDKSVNPLSRGNFSNDENRLTFQFTCISLSSAGQQEFHYQLAGFDKTWHQTRERYVKYTNLPPGHYQFHVRAVNRKDNTVATLSSYAFVIKPAFYQQWWFPILVVSVLIMLLTFLFQRRLNNIRNRNTLLLELAENRQKALVQLIHPHFVFNLMNTIQGAVLKEDRIRAASLIARLSKLMRLSMELGKEKWVSLAREVDLLNKYFELEEVRSPGIINYRIEAAEPLRFDNILVPSMLIQPFVENAIKHGVMHLADRQGIIHILFHLEGESLVCTVDDNGIGRKEAGRINRFRPDGHQSSGIEITINRLRLLHQEQGTPFYYEVTDKENSQGEAQGTTIKFSIPYKNSL